MNRKEINIPAVLFMIVIISSLFINTLYFTYFFPLILAMIIRKIRKQQMIKMGPADIIVLSLCAVEILELFVTGYLPNTVKASNVIFCGATLWFVMRFYMKDQATIRAFVSIVSLLAGVLAFVTLIGYYRHKSQFASVGMTDMTMVKQYFRPFGLALNEWVAVLVCSLPFPFYMAVTNRKRIPLFMLHLLSFTIVNVSIIVSFSRSGYLALLVFDFLAVVLSISYWKKYFFSAILVAALGLSASFGVLFPEKDSVRQTGSVNGTTSQKRSTEGRTRKWAEAIELFKQSPVVGTGSGNYELASRLYGSKKYNSLSYRSTNTALQILVEKGLIGAIVYLLAFCTGCFCCFRSMRSRFICVPFVAALFSLCLREMFFNSFFDNRIFGLFIIMFFIINQTVEYSED